MQRIDSTRSLYWQGVDDPSRFSSATVQFAGDTLSAFGESWTREYELTWQLSTVSGWVTDRLEVRVLGLGSNKGSLNRALFLHRSASGEWSAQTVRSESGGGGAPLPRPGIQDPDSLVGAADCDLGLCPLTNTMPIRRLGLHRAAADPEPETELLMAWVEVPSLRVIASRQAYVRSPGQPGRVRYRGVGTDFMSDLLVDGDGLVTDYPGLARQTERFAMGA